MRHLLIIIFFINSFSFSQTKETQEITRNIYEKLVSKVGNNFTPAPKLKITTTQREPAKISNGTIFIEQKLIDLLSNDDNFESRIAYVLSHELGHHYLDHGWARGTGFAYVNDIETASIEQRKENYQYLLRDRVLDETNADKWGGFVAQISGYNSLQYADETLRMIYEHYDIDLEIPGYPSFNRRLEIIESNIDKSNTLAKVFEVGNKALLFGLTSLAETSYTELINNKLNTREIHNNLGVAYLLKAISDSENLSNYNYPIFIDNNTVAKVATRNVDSNKLSPKQLLEKAIKEFEFSYRLDSTYESTQINIIISKMLLLKIDGTLKKSFLKEFMYSNSINSFKKKELEVLFKSLKSKKNTPIITNEKDLEIPVFKDEKIDEAIGFGLSDFNPTTFRIPNSNIRIREKKFEIFNITELSNIGQNIYFVEIFDNKYLMDIESFVQEANYSFDRTIEIDFEIYKVDLSNKFAIKYKGDSIYSVSIVIE